MCKPASMIVVKGQPPFWSKKTESHTEIRKEFGLPENTDTLIANVQVEITPPNGDFAAPLKDWVFRTDQDLLPKWWDAKEAEAAVRKELKAWAKCKLIRHGEKRDVNDGDCIIAVCGGTVNAVCGGTVNEVWGGTVNEVWGGTVNAVCGGTVNAVRGGTVCFYATFSVKFSGAFSVIINRIGNAAKCLIGSEKERIATDKDNK